jgi:hypothetical protein
MAQTWFIRAMLQFGDKAAAAAKKVLVEHRRSKTLQLRPNFRFCGQVLSGSDLRRPKSSASPKSRRGLASGFEN